MIENEVEQVEDVTYGWNWKHFYTNVGDLVWTWVSIFNNFIFSLTCLSDVTISGKKGGCFVIGIFIYPGSVIWRREICG